ncbi:MAG TPA: VOC family protein [Myxococcota bacterium]|jgi:catechol 2,3-dioxygenase-like lactoylglutathione lyase family enzyme|nr:VOC family protein [Myxococcota bacterium]
MDTSLSHVDHVALPAYDLDATHRFYAGVLGLDFRGEQEGRSELWGGRGFRLRSYAAAGGALFDFFQVEGLARPDDALPVGLRHVALAVGSRAAVEAWRATLRAAGVWTSELVDHDGTHDSVYCFDPNGHQLEITWRRPHAAEPPR